MARQHKTVICREGRFYLIVLVLVYCGALLHEVNLLLVLGGMLVGPLLFSVSAVRTTLRDLKVQRKIPPGICAGDLLVAQVSVTNTRRRIGSWGVLVEEDIRREEVDGREEPLCPGVLFPHVPVGESRRGTYSGRLQQRGRYQFGPTRISTRFPFGLLRHTVTHAGTDTLVVFPRLGRLTRRWVMHHHEAFTETHRRERRSGLEGDFYGTREWHSGDSQRQIHWRSSARTGTLVVRQFERPRNRDVVVLLDLWQPQQPTAQQIGYAELAVSFAATVVTDVCRKGGGSLAVCVGGARPNHVRGEASPGVLRQAMEILAMAKAGHEDRLASLLTVGRETIEPGAEVVLVSTRPAEDPHSSGTAVSVAARGLESRAGRIRRIDTSGNQLSEFFHPK